MSLLTSLKRSALWQPFARIYQRSGLKAKVYSRAWTPPVRSISQAEAFALFDLTAKSHQPAPAFAPPIKANCGPMPPEDADFLARFVAAYQPKRAFEFGTNWGVSTAVLAANSPADSKIWTLDVHRHMFDEAALKADPELQMILLEEHTGWHYKTVPQLAAKVTQIFADSMKFDMASAFTEIMDFDLVLVDACHKYDFIQRDTENALKRLAPGACVLWHDYYPQVNSWTDVFCYLNDLARTLPGIVHVEGTQLALWKKPA